ncbi:hypothetical protein BD560DRAFT_440605 [Blakeslea trispora]|nr:hypothetical protein BD560DRAFT_440605 [Blakeslea trispora]
MSLQRQQTLDHLYNVLKTPEDYGDHFLVKIVDAPKDGLVSLDLLRNMATVLNEYPSEYLAHCIPLDKQERFVWNSDFSRVGLKERAQWFETDPYGFMQQPDQIQDEAVSAVQPVIYDDGRFYVDNEHTRNQIRHAPKQPRAYQYDLLDMEPLGKRQFDDIYLPDTGAECFNCGSTEHKISQCPLPRNASRIGRKKREHHEAHARNFFEALPSHSFEPGKLSDTLKYALGILENESEPPYYTNMRYFGYPPGYLKKEDDDILKIYGPDGNEVAEEENEETKNNMMQIFSNSSQNEQTVVYPGLDLPKAQQGVNWDYYHQWYAYQQQWDPQQQPHQPWDQQQQWIQQQSGLEEQWNLQQQWEDYYKEQARQWEEYNQSNSINHTLPCQPSENKTTVITDDQSVDMDLSSDEDSN